MTRQQHKWAGVDFNSFTSKTKSTSGSIVNFKPSTDRANETEWEFGTKNEENREDILFENCASQQTCIVQRHGCFDSFLSLLSASCFLYISCGSNQPLFDLSNEKTFYTWALAENWISTGPIWNGGEGTSRWCQLVSTMVVSLGLRNVACATSPITDSVRRWLDDKCIYRLWCNRLLYPSIPHPWNRR